MCGIYVIVIWYRVSILWLLAIAMLLAASASNSLINAALLALLWRLLRTCVDLGGDDEKRQLMWEWVMDGDVKMVNEGDLDQRMRQSKRVVRCLPSSMI